MSGVCWRWKRWLWRVRVRLKVSAEAVWIRVELEERREEVVMVMIWSGSLEGEVSNEEWYIGEVKRLQSSCRVVRCRE